MQQIAPASRTQRAAELFLLAVLIAVFAIYGFIPAWRVMNTDFPNYYIAASIHRQGISLERAYEWRWFQRQKDYLQVDQSLVGFAPHPPMCALPMLPLAGLPSLEAKRVWLILNLGFLALMVWILSRVTDLGWRRLSLLTFLCILPLRENFLFGQYYVLILLLLSLAYYSVCRGWRFTSGAVLAAAASLKIFPIFFLLLFLRKRNWRAVAGMVAGGAALAAISLLVFGWNVHKVYLLEVLPRALHGDLVGPYVLQWNSFTALCHRFFLREPEMNPTPWLDSPTAYSVVQALMAAVLLFSYLLSTGDEDTPQTTAWEWATFLPLLILLSSMPTAYHHCVLILAAVVAANQLLKAGKHGKAAAVAILFAAACFPLPGFLWLNLQGRLIAVFLLYVLLLWEAPARARGQTRTVGLALAALFLAFLTFSNLRSLRGRSQDFSRRLPPVSAGYGTFSASRAGTHLLLDEMLIQAFGVVVLPDQSVQPTPAKADVLAVASGSQSPLVYFELTGKRSQIFRVPTGELGRIDAPLEYVEDGHDPAISDDGRWLAFLHEEHGETTIFISKDGAPATPLRTSPSLAGVLETSVAINGNLIVAAGGAADPHLSVVDATSGDVHPLPDVLGAVRYPAISADGQWLAFSRRESGSWHLFVRDLAHGTEQQLTSAACNATSPAWENPHSLLYVSDCGRGLALSAPARVSVP